MKKQKMRKIGCFLLAFTLLLSGMPMLQVDAAATPMELYVATTGDDSADGMTAATPLQTLDAARNKIREMKENNTYPEGGVIVNIRGGEYSYVENSFTLEAQDSGTESAPVIYRAYEGEEVKIVGSRTLDGADFEKVTDSAILERLSDDVQEKVLVYDINTKLGIDTFSPITRYGFGTVNYVGPISVLVDGEPQTLSRYPNDDYMKIASVQSETGFTINGIQDKYSLWNQEPDIWTFGYFYYDWADDTCAVASLSQTGSGVAITTHNTSKYGFKKNQRVYAYNLLCEIDSPGEWYLDRDEAKLYLYPTKDISQSNVALTLQDAPLVVMDSVKYVQWQNVTFSQTNSHGIVMKNCENCEIAGCEFSDIGAKAIFIGDPEMLMPDSEVYDPNAHNVGTNGGKNNTVRSCNMTRLGMGGVYLGGGNRYKLEAGNNIVINCDISDFATVSRTYAAAVDLFGCGNSARRNRTYDAPHLAIRFAGNDFSIEGNEIFNVCTETSDCGAIYTGRRWSAQGTVIKNNYIHDVLTNAGTGSAAVYLDDLGSGVTVTQNLMVNITGRATLIGGGRDNIITNNILINNGNGKGFYYDQRGHDWYWYGAAGPSGAVYNELTTLRANANYDKAKWDEKYPSLAQIDLTTTGNRPSGEADKGENYANYYIEAAKPANNTVANNIAVGSSTSFDIKPLVVSNGNVSNNQPYSKGTDIGFTNAGTYDFTVEEGSIIKQIQGDNYFDVSQMGLYIDEYRTTLGVSVDAPQLVNPVAGTTNVQPAIPISFGWSEVENAGVYALEISKDQAFADVVKAINTTETSALISGLEGETTYYWRVKAVESRVGGNVGTSEVYSFTTSKASISYFEGFYDFEKWSGTGTPTKTTEQAYSGLYSYKLDESKEVIQYDFGEAQQGVMTLYMYDNGKTGKNTSAVVDVVGTTAVGSAAYMQMGIRGEKSKTHYVISIDGTYSVTTVERTVGWHKLTWDFSDSETSKMYIDDSMVYERDVATSFVSIKIGDYWAQNNKYDDICGMYFDHVTIGTPELKENVVSITVPDNDITLQIDGSYQIEAVAEANPDIDVELMYTVADNTLATVDDKGLLTAKKAGTTTVTIQGKENPTESAVATITITIEGVSISEDTLELVEGQEHELSATIVSTSATGQSITWASSDSSVATVDESGKVTAIAAGTATITATAGDKTATCEVTVSLAPTATPIPTATPAPSEAPTATPAPSEAPTATPAPSEAPTATPVPSEAPTATPAPSEVPTPGPADEDDNASDSNNDNNNSEAGNDTTSTTTTPDTGDNSNVRVWSMMLVLACSAAISILIVRKKNRI